jgi:hypothetical protein
MVPWDTRSWAGGYPRGPLAPPPPPTGRTLEEEVVTALIASPYVDAIVGDQIFPGAIPQTAALPALCYRVISVVRDYHLRDAGGMKWVRIRFLARSHAHSDLIALLESLRNRFEGLLGVLGALTIHFVLLENEVDDYEEPLPGSDLGVHSKQFDLRFKLRESLPTHV